MSLSYAVCIITVSHLPNSEQNVVVTVLFNRLGGHYGWSFSCMCMYIDAYAYMIIMHYNTYTIIDY